VPAADEQRRQDAAGPVHDICAIGVIVDDGQRLRVLELLNLCLLCVEDLTQSSLVPLAVEAAAFQVLGKLLDRCPGTVDVHGRGEDVDLIEDASVGSQEH